MDKRLTDESDLISRDDLQRETLERINTEFDCSLYIHLTACPVNVSGYTEDGYWTEFYARGSGWNIYIGHPQHPVFRRDGKTEGDFSASWLEPDAMETILRECLTAYRAEARRIPAVNAAAGQEGD